MQLFLLFLEYAKTSPRLGLTLREFKEFLIAECYVNAYNIMEKLMSVYFMNLSTCAVASRKLHKKCTAKANAASRLPTSNLQEVRCSKQAR